MASGFNNTPTPASEFHRHSSWGRTRQPKNIAGPHGTKVVDIDAGTMNDDDTAARAARGYATENQRYLHVTCEAGGSVTAIYVYSHAFDRWSELVDSSGASLTVGNSEHKIFTIAGVDRAADDRDWET